MKITTTNTISGAEKEIMVEQNKRAKLSSSYEYKMTTDDLSLAHVKTLIDTVSIFSNKTIEKGTTFCCFATTMINESCYLILSNTTDIVLCPAFAVEETDDVIFIFAECRDNKEDTDTGVYQYVITNTELTTVENNLPIPNSTKMFSICSLNDPSTDIPYFFLTDFKNTIVCKRDDFLTTAEF